MAEALIPPVDRGDVTAVTAGPRTDHELVSFAVFLDYRAKRMRAPLAEVPAPDAPTTLADPPAPKGNAASKR
jgi:hypothetical protein